MISMSDVGDGMNVRSALAAVTLLVVVIGGTVGALGPSAAAMQDDGAVNESDASTGERMAGVVGIERAAVTGTVERARFERAIDAVSTDSARARTIATYLNRSRQRLTALRARARKLDEAQANGSLSAGEYAARTARLGARARNVQLLSVELANASAALPRDLRRQYDIEPVALRSFADEAAALAERVGGPTNRVDPAVFSDVSRLIGAYNAQVQADDAGVLAAQFRGERVNLHVESAADARVVVSFAVAEDGRLTEVRAGPRGDATLQAVTDRRTVQRIATTDDAASAFYRAVQDDDIRTNGIGFVNRLKWRLIDVLTSL